MRRGRRSEPWLAPPPPGAPALPALRRGAESVCGGPRPGRGRALGGTGGQAGPAPGRLPAPLGGGEARGVSGGGCGRGRRYGCASRAGPTSTAPRRTTGPAPTTNWSASAGTASGGRRGSRAEPAVALVATPAYHAHQPPHGTSV